MAEKKLPSRICKRLAYMIKDERKAAAEYISLAEDIKKVAPHLGTVLARISASEASHEGILSHIFESRCRR